VSRGIAGAMTAIAAQSPRSNDPHEELVERAGRLGFSLATREMDTGQTVWEWHRRDEPSPQFVTPRVALQWMSEWILNHEKRT